jgi:hypothetical protein
VGADGGATGNGGWPPSLPSPRGGRRKPQHAGWRNASDTRHFPLRRGIGGIACVPLTLLALDEFLRGEFFLVKVKTYRHGKVSSIMLLE